MTVERALAIVLCGMVLPGAVALAQDACPVQATCYEGHELEFDKADGPIQFLVVETIVKTSTTLDEQTTSSTVRLAEFRSDGDRYVLVADDLRYPKTGVLATASLGDTFGLTEIGGE